MMSPYDKLRTLRIMDALIKGLLERGFEVYQEDDVFKVQIHGENLGFGTCEEVTTAMGQVRSRYR